MTKNKIDEGSRYVTAKECIEAIFSERETAPSIRTFKEWQAFTAIHAFPEGDSFCTWWQNDSFFL